MIKIKGNFFEKKEYKTLHYLIAMLEAYGVKYVVASPGMQNAKFNSIVQEKSEFNCISIVDERSAAYVATGISFETQEPVVITCTGATASRNYLSALTEAYYRKIPIIAVTFYRYTSNEFNMSPQFVDRSVIQNDVKYISVTLPNINNNDDKRKALVYLNAALTAAVYKKVPVHIDCPASYDFELDLSLPDDIWKNEYVFDDLEKLKENLVDKNFAVFIGSHHKFSEQEEQALSDFAISWGIPVFCDHTSGYNGENKVLTAQAAKLIDLKQMPELIIDIGDLTGEYSSSALFKKAKIWRVTPDGDFKSRFSFRIEKTIVTPEEKLFRTLINKNNTKVDYFLDVKKQIDKIIIPELPLSCGLVCQKMAEYMPKKSSLHLAILNCLRNMNFFELSSQTTVNSNVGGFGIDGPLSTLLGQALVSPKEKVFGIVGDLAFFYDMNALGYRNIPNNLRILLINNNKGEEFIINPTIEKPLGEKTNELIAAAGHNKNGAKAWVESCGFHYMFAKDKKSFLNQVQDFCNYNYAKPVVFEVFTTDEDEKFGLNIIQSFNK